ncbi:hypothetical protein [Actinomadura rupiterrae]|uniref:hypothetical protein n=1 Tax=Actinomadura rupiterrae TaxID=559627 RepID=UPI0020A3BFEA|nr:hypothetical protein [Actinomadura rupiterrae]MCP2337880.1 NTP pyrophosphatase (non-canonical NTP hydrolase) [Actinomadura rupiterrae]
MHDTASVQPAAPDPAQMARLAADITRNLREHFPQDGERVRQALALAEEAGEFVAAYRRWTGRARRTGTHTDMAAELADVLITAYVTAHVLDLTPDPDPTAAALHDDPDRQVAHLFRTTAQFVDNYLDDDEIARDTAVQVWLPAVIAATHGTANAVGIDLPTAVDAKAQTLFTRGWRDPR